MADRIKVQSTRCKYMDDDKKITLLLTKNEFALLTSFTQMVRDGSALRFGDWLESNPDQVAEVDALSDMLETMDAEFTAAEAGEEALN